MPASGLPRIVLGVHVVEGILAEGHCPSLLDHPAVEIFAADIAHGDGAAVAVSVPFLAANRSLTDRVSERQRRLLATTIRFLIRLAELGTFRGVNAVQTNSLAADLDGVAVDDRRRADDTLPRRRGQR